MIFFYLFFFDKGARAKIHSTTYEAFSLYPGTETYPFAGRQRKSTDLKILILVHLSVYKSEFCVVQKIEQKMRFSSGSLKF